MERYTASKPLLPSALPPKGEASRYGANIFLNLIALLAMGHHGFGRCLKETRITRNCVALWLLTRVANRNNRIEIIEIHFTQNFSRETLIKSLSDFTLGFLCIARNNLTRIASD